MTMSMRERRKRALMLYNALGGGTPIEWLLRVEFSTDRGAIGSGTYAGEVGEVTITDTGNNVTVSGGAARFSAEAALNDPRFDAAAITRAAGLMWWHRGIMRPRTLSGLLAGVVTLAYIDTANNSYFDNNSLISNVFTTVAGVDNQYWHVFQTTGHYVFNAVGAGTVKLAWVSVVGSSNPSFRYASFGSSSADERTLDHVRARQLEGAVWTTLNGLASVNVSSPASGASQTATANAISDIAFTLDGTPTANEKVELRYRVQDASNYWSGYIQRNAGNTAWDAKLDSTVASVTTNRISVTGVNPSRLRVIYDGSLHDMFTLNGTTWTKRGTQINVASLSTETAINTTYDAGNTVSTLISFPRTSAEYAELSRT